LKKWNLLKGCKKLIKKWDWLNMNLLKFTLRRLVICIPVVFGVFILTFFMSRIMPGNPFLEPGIWVKGDPDFVRKQLEFYGLDQPIHIQFYRYMKGMFSGDWGESFKIAEGITVWDLVKMKFPITIEIGIYGTLLSSFIGIRTGAFSATHRNKPSDTIIRTLSIIGAAIPVFVLGILFQRFLGMQLDLFPIFGKKSPGFTDPPTITSFRLIDTLITGHFLLFLDTLWHYFLPVISLALIQIAEVTRMSRSSMLEVMELDYIRCARAKGCSEKRVIRKHALKNAMIPTVTVIGMKFANILANTILIEVTFSLNGFGMLFVEAIMKREYFIISAQVFLISMVFTVIIVIVDILYAIIDPRIRY
jgi:peptide/nickel transport system permease protein